METSCDTGSRTVPSARSNFIQSQRSHQHTITAGAISTAPGSRTAATLAVHTQCGGWEPLAVLPAVLYRPHELGAVRPLLYVPGVSRQQPLGCLDPNFVEGTAADINHNEPYVHGKHHVQQSDCEAPAGAYGPATKGEKPTQQCEALLGTSGRPPSLTGASGSTQSAQNRIAVYFLLYAATAQKVANAECDANFKARHQEIAAEREACTGLGVRLSQSDETHCSSIVDPRPTVGVNCHFVRFFAGCDLCDFAISLFPPDSWCFFFHSCYSTGTCLVTPD